MGEQRGAKKEQRAGAQAAQSTQSQRGSGEAVGLCSLPRALVQGNLAHCHRPDSQ